MGNFLRFVSTKIVFTTIGSRNANELQILVATNSETPTITWNNQTSEDIARDIHDNISQIVSNLRIEASTAAPMIWVKRHSKPPLEVKVMQPLFKTSIKERVTGLKETKCSLNLIQQFVVPKTTFDKLRRKGLILILFIQNILVAVIFGMIVEKLIKPFF